MEVVKNSEHGLGHLLNPLDPESESKDWMVELWILLRARELGLDVEELEWLDHPAVSQLTISTQNLSEPFKERNEGREYQDQIKPTNFMLVAHTGHYGAPPEVDPGQPFQLIAPFTPNPSEWRQMPWYDKYGRGEFYITTSDRGTAERVRVQSYRDVFERYRRRPEVTALGWDGEICGKQTRGVLQPRPVKAKPVIPIGKESNRLEEVQAGAVQDRDEVEETYDREHRYWQEYLRPRFNRIVEERTKAQVARALDVSERTVQRWTNNISYPTPQNQRRIARLV